MASLPELLRAVSAAQASADPHRIRAARGRLHKTLRDALPQDPLVAASCLAAVSDDELQDQLQPIADRVQARVGEALGLLTDSQGQGQVVEVLVELSPGGSGTWTAQNVERDALVAAVEGDASGAVRAAALAALLSWPADQELYTTATVAFEASSIPTIRRAALALAVHADRDGALALLSAMKVPDGDVEDLGALRLEALVHARAPGLAGLLLGFSSNQGASRATRMVAIRSLGALIFVPDFGSQARRALVELLRDPDPGLALLAAEVLGRAAARGDVGAQEELVQAFAGLTDPRMQRVVRGVWTP